jgi:hypothetical protein
VTETKTKKDSLVVKGVPATSKLASSLSTTISSTGPAKTTAAQESQQRKAAEQSSRTPTEDLMLFLDLGNSQTQVAYCWRGKQLSWFDNWGGEDKIIQVPTVVTAYRKRNGEWTRTFGRDGKLDSHYIEGAVVFDRLKMNFDPDSEYLDDQKQKEKKTGYCDNWNFLIESYLTAVFDGIVDPKNPPKRVYTYMGPSSKVGRGYYCKIYSQCGSTSQVGWQI